MKVTKEYVSKLAIAVGQEGDGDAFKELEEIAKPLLVSLSRKFSEYHYKFEYDEFYSIALGAMYNACLTYNDRNPSFLDYARVLIIRELLKEVNYWNRQKRDIFSYSEVSIDSPEVENIPCEDDMVDEALISEFRDEVSNIIDRLFNEDKAKILKMYLLEDMRVIEISEHLDVKYKYAYSTIQRGTSKIIEEYEKNRSLTN